MRGIAWDWQAGYHLATGKVPVVYIQNSGEGNVINPIASLLNEKVYAIPMIFMAVIGANRPENLVHIIINNGAHETVGGMPTVASDLDMVKLAEACGYPYVASVSSAEELDKELERAVRSNELSLIEVKAAIGARENLGRPMLTARENKEGFMQYLRTVL